VNELPETVTRDITRGSSPRLGIYLAGTTEEQRNHSRLGDDSPSFEMNFFHLCFFFFKAGFMHKHQLPASRPAC